ncbi:metallophosphoesterase family protein, partial [Liquorilactobacillus ghanensis]
LKSQKEVIILKKIALIADVHGNYTALQAVLADASRRKVDDYLVLGDIVNRGPVPEKCLHALQAKHPAAWVIGNHEQVYQSLLQQKFQNFADNEKAILAIITSEFDRRYLTHNEFSWLANLPLCQEVTIEKLKLRIFHATPISCRGHLTVPTAPQANFDELLAASTAQVAIYGHTHQVLLRQTSDGRLIINPGSIGLAVSKQQSLAAAQAKYAILTIADRQLLDCQFLSVPYDVDSEIKLAEKRRVPFARLYTFLLQTGTFTYTETNVHKENAAHNYRQTAQQLIAQNNW